MTSEQFQQRKSEERAKREEAQKKRTHKFGDVHPATGKIFWGIGTEGRERWEELNKFEKRRKGLVDGCRRRRKSLTVEQLEELRARSRSHYWLNWDRSNARSRNYRRSFPEKVRECNRKSRLKRRRTNLLYRLSVNIASAINQSLKLRKYHKKCRTMEVLGCTFDFFRKHIEAQFVEGMDWGMRGRHLIGGPRVWHVDHKIPLASAKTESELIALWHYSNLRPMWGRENISKSDFLPCGTRARYKSQPQQPVI